jgi:hypothetical protein
MTPQPVGIGALAILMHALAGWACCGALST